LGLKGFVVVVVGENKLKLAFIGECDKWLTFKTQVTSTQKKKSEEQLEKPSFASFPGEAARNL